jgi:uncharacterized protein YegL
MAYDDVMTLEQRRQSAANEQVVFVYYLLADVSVSMAPHIQELNAKLVEFRDKFRGEPILEDITRLGVISFSDTARVAVPLGNYAEAEFSNDLLAVEGSTSYAAAFRQLRQSIESDLARLKAADKAASRSNEVFKYYRPCVFFLTDGYPNNGDPWQREFDELKRMKQYPLFVPYGFGDARLDVLKALVHPQQVSKLYLARHGASVAKILDEMLNSMINSILVSAHSAFSTPRLALPAPVSKDIEVYQFGPDGDFV